MNSNNRSSNNSNNDNSSSNNAVQRCNSNINNINDINNSNDNKTSDTIARSRPSFPRPRSERRRGQLYFTGDSAQRDRLQNGSAFLVACVSDMSDDWLSRARRRNPTITTTY